MLLDCCVRLKCQDLSREEFFRIDGVSEDVAKQREAGLDRMSADWAKRRSVLSPGSYFLFWQPECIRIHFLRN